MPKTRDLPSELRDFNKLFETLSYRYDNYDVFNDFLDFFINYFSFNHRIDLEHMRKKYTLEERHKFHQLIMEAIKVYDKMIVYDKDWYDFFGDFYQVLSSKSKASRFGQFFTPESVCDFMVQIIDIKAHETLNEPTCGSGRLNLAAHVQNPKLFHVAQDLDYMCVRMSALNFMMHGIDGVVICMDTLTLNPDSFRGAFRVNRWLKYTGIPQIEFISNVNHAFSFLINKSVAKNTTKKQLLVQENLKPLVNEKTNQIMMF